MNDTLELLLGEKHLGDDGLWHVYDPSGVELTHASGVLFRSILGALLWPRVLDDALRSGGPDGATPSTQERHEDDEFVPFSRVPMPTPATLYQREAAGIEAARQAAQQAIAQATRAVTAPVTLIKSVSQDESDEEALLLLLAL